MQVPAELLLEDVALLVFPAQATGSCGSSRSGTIPSARLSVPSAEHPKSQHCSAHHYSFWVILGKLGLGLLDLTSVSLSLIIFSTL